MDPQKKQERVVDALDAIHEMFDAKEVDSEKDLSEVSMALMMNLSDLPTEERIEVMFEVMDRLNAMSEPVAWAVVILDHAPDGEPFNMAFGPFGDSGDAHRARSRILDAHRSDGSRPPDDVIVVPLKDPTPEESHRG